MKKLLIDDIFTEYQDLINNNVSHEFVNIKNFDDLIKNNHYDGFILSEIFIDDLYKIKKIKKLEKSFIVSIHEQNGFGLVSDFLIKDSINKDSFKKALNKLMSINSIPSEASISYILKQMLTEKDGDINTQIYRIPYLTKFVVSKLIEENIYDCNKENKVYHCDIIDFSLFHDIGKLNILDDIVNYTGIYDDKQRKHMQLHPKLGYEFYNVITNVFPTFKSEVASNMILYHHEKFDGTGYPFGLKGEDIPLEARIIAVIDVYDALRSNRKYKEGFSHEKAIEILNKDKGTHFDPVIINCLLKYEKELKKLYNELL